MTKLVQFHVAQHADNIHHSGVKLQAHIGWTNMVTDTEKCLSHQAESHGVENTHLLK